MILRGTTSYRDGAHAFENAFNNHMQLVAIILQRFKDEWSSNYDGKIVTSFSYYIVEIVRS